MTSFSTDKQRDKVNAEWMSRPVDSFKKSKNNQPLVLVLISMEQSLTFAYRLKRKLLSGLIFGGAYRITVITSDLSWLVNFTASSILLDSFNDSQLNGSCSSLSFKAFINVSTLSFSEW